MTPVAFVTDQGRFTSAAVQTSLKATATVMVTCLTLLVCVAVLVQLTQMPMVFVTMSTTALVLLTVRRVQRRRIGLYRLCRPSCQQLHENNIFEDNGQCVYATTFNVDMNCFDNAGASVGGAASFYEVFVTGPFCWMACK